MTNSIFVEGGHANCDREDCHDDGSCVGCDKVKVIILVDVTRCGYHNRPHLLNGQIRVAEHADRDVIGKIFNGPSETAVRQIDGSLGKT